MIINVNRSAETPPNESIQRFISDIQPAIDPETLNLAFQTAKIRQQRLVSDRVEEEGRVTIAESLGESDNATIQIAVVERRTWWTAELQRQSLDSTTNVRQFVSVASLLEQSEFVADLAIVVWSHPESGMANLRESELRTLADSTKTVLVLDPSELHCEWLLREAGIIDIVAPPITGIELSRLVTKYTSGENPSKSLAQK